MELQKELLPMPVRLLRFRNGNRRVKTQYPPEGRIESGGIGGIVSAFPI